MLLPTVRAASSSALAAVGKNVLLSAEAASCRSRLSTRISSTTWCHSKLTNAASRSRPYATVSGNSLRNSTNKAGGIRVGTLFLALSILGIGATSVGLYNYYTSLKTFPPELRKELRGALRCKARQDYRAAHKFFLQAWERIMSDPELEQDLGLLKITGVAVAWSELLEEASRRADQGSVTDAASEAYGALLQGYDWGREYLRQHATSATNEEKMRVVSIAVKLANLAESQEHLDKQSEEQLTWAVEEVLRLATQGTPKDVQQSKKPDSEENAILVGELGLPKWVTKTDLGGTLETLGNLYARKGNVEYAMPLYLQTISLLLPPPQVRQHEPSTGDKCHAATIMNNLSSLIASAPKTPSQNISQSAQATAWANKSVEIASMAMSGASGSISLQEAEQCKPTLTVAFYNLGMLKLLEGDKEAAKRLLDQAKEKAEEWGFKDAESRASEVLASL